MQNSNAANAWTSDSFAAFFVQFLDEPCSNMSCYQEWDAVFSSWISQCNATVLHPGLIQSLRDEKFDVAFAEAIDFCAPGEYSLFNDEIQL